MLALLACSILVGCPSWMRNGNDEKWKAVRTPAGYRAEVLPFQAIDEATVLRWLDARIAEWIAARTADGRDPAELRRVASLVLYRPIDDYRIRTGSSGTGYASGQYFANSALVESCVYARGTSPTTPTSPPAVAHTIRQNDEGGWSYGYIPEGGIGLASVPHELDHAINIGH